MRVLTAADGPVGELAFSPTGDALVGSVVGRGVFLWELPAGTVRKLTPGKRFDGADSFRFSADGRRVSWQTTYDRYEYDRDTGGLTTVSRHAPERVNDEVLTGPAGRLIRWTVQRDVGFRLRGYTPDGAGGWVPNWVVGPDWALGAGPIAGTAADRFFTLEYPRNRGEWKLVARSAATGDVEASAVFPYHGCCWMAAAPDGSCVVAVHEMTLVVWHPGREPEKVRSDTRKHFTGVAFHPSGRLLATINNDATVRVFDTATWAVVRQFTWDIGKLQSVAFSPDGAVAAAGGDDGRVVLWDVDG